MAVALRRYLGARPTLLVVIALVFAVFAISGGLIEWMVIPSAAARSGAGHPQTILWLDLLASAAALSTILVVAIERRLLAPLRHAADAVEACAWDDADARLPHPSGEPGALVAAVEVLRRGAQRALQEERERNALSRLVHRALEQSSAEVFIADADDNVVFLTTVMLKNLKRADQLFRTVHPDYAGDKVLGSKLGWVFGPQDYEKRMRQARELTKTRVESYTYCGQSLVMTMSPVVDLDGARIGTVIDWRNATAEVMVQKQLNDVLKAAAAGDFSGRLAIEDKQKIDVRDEGFARLASSLNTLLETVSGAFTNVLVALDALSAGDLGRTMEGSYEGRLLHLQTATNQTVFKLRELIGNIQHSAERILQSSQDIVTGSNDLSARTESQAASLEQAAASMEQMASTVRQSADTAERTNEVVVNAANFAERGGKLVSEVVTTMTQIDQSSARIADIIGVIDGIAFQTNILALNAAVEAARAGEHGRGFAVVAAEVRALSQRSAAAAKEIKDLIGESVERVGSGAKLVQEMGSTMQDIVKGVRGIGEMMSMLTVAAREQSVGIDQVNQTITQLDDFTRQTASLVEESTGTAGGLKDEAASLLQAAQRFRLDATARPSAAAPGSASRNGRSAADKKPPPVAF
jgi:methyl-accepting chemotaxis protein